MLAKKKEKRIDAATGAVAMQPESWAAAPQGLPSRPEIAIHLQRVCQRVRIP